MFNRRCSVIGVIHLPPLPGSAGYKGSIEEILNSALNDAMTYKKESVDALIVENMHDAPYLKGYVEPETVAAMAVVANTVKREAMLPTGVQLLAAANLESLGVAVSCGLDFIRAEGFVFAHVGDEGLHESSAAVLMRRRAYLKGEHIRIFADIKKKHSSHAITSDISLTETARTAEFFGADGVIITGGFTSEPADAREVEAVRLATSAKVLVGSGVTAENIRQYSEHADALIVGSAFKHEGNWRNKVDPERVKRLMAAATK
ncbi:MAG: BtpA/SgcQ family protein [Candidatus Obscuribacterales bacterium]|nr:BtpA/SgcQ family protein [Candidatus Obscuribacterales bacterium]